MKKPGGTKNWIVIGKLWNFGQIYEYYSIKWKKYCSNVHTFFVKSKISLARVVILANSINWRLAHHQKDSVNKQDIIKIVVCCSTILMILKFRCHWKIFVWLHVNVEAASLHVSFVSTFRNSLPFIYLHVRISACTGWWWRTSCGSAGWKTTPAANPWLPDITIISLLFKHSWISKT